MPQGGFLVLRFHVVSEDLPCQAELDTIGRNRTSPKVWVTDERMPLGDTTSHDEGILEVISEVEGVGLDENMGDGVNLSWGCPNARAPF